MRADTVKVPAAAARVWIIVLRPPDDWVCGGVDPLEDVLLVPVEVAGVAVHLVLP